MSDNNPFGFGKFVPGFDFLQNIAKGAQGMPQMPALSNWVAPTLNVEEVEKRISELKAVLFWLDQNRQALGATIQALEVQKMTLATLKGMNLSMNELADALKVPAAASSPAPEKAQAAERPAGAAVDPLQWWGALTQQFQQIASAALDDVAQKARAEPGLGQVMPAVATPPAKAARSAAKTRAKAPRKSAPRKAATR